MTEAVITSYTMVDFPSESDLTAFFVFVEKNYDQLSSDLRANGMIKFYVTRVFNKDGKYTVGNWLEYKDQHSYAACDKVRATFMAEVASKATSFVVKVSAQRGIVQYDYS